MKVSNFSTDHSLALIRGWVDATAATGAGIGKVTQSYLNNTAGTLVVGDVVVIDSAADLAVTTTTTAQDTRIVGIVQDTILAGAIGPILTAGYAALVNVVSAVTRGYFAETSTTVKLATQNVDRRAGSFGIYLSAGTAPACLLFGGGDSAGGTGSGGPGLASSLRTISPAQLTANTNNWNPTGLSTADVIRASTDASRNLTGIVAPSASRMIALENVGAFDLVLIHDATSTAANRFYCADNTDLTLPQNSGVLLIYDETSDRWRVIGGTGGGGASVGPAMASYAETIGDTIATTFTINHALATNDVVVLVYRVASPFDQVFPEIDLTDANNLDVVFTVAPGTDEFRVVVLAAGVTPTFRGCKAKSNSTTALTTANTEYPIALAAADEYDTDAFHDPASNNTRLTVPSALDGYYFQIIGHIYCPVTAGNNYLDLKIRKNGAAGTVIAQVRHGAAEGNPIIEVVSPPVALAATDYVEMFGMSNVATLTVDANESWFSIQMVGTP